MADEFGFNRRKTIWDEYIGKYVTINPASQQSAFSGRLVRIEEGPTAVLNPYSGGEWDAEKGFIRQLIYKNSKVDLPSGTAIEQITKKNLENYCEYQNKHEAEKRAKENQEPQTTK